MNTMTRPRRLALPEIDTGVLAAVLVAGAAATIAFDLFGKALSPLLGFATLAPVPLAKQSVAAITGIDSTPLAHLVHYLTGLIAYPAGWFFVVKPLADRFAQRLPWPVTSALYGVALWVFALYVMAHLVAGNPAFLGFTGITWVALVGHVIFTVVAAFAAARSTARSDDR